MGEERIRHKGKDIVIRKFPNRTPQLYVAGKKVPVFKDEKSGEYASTDLPYRNYKSLEELAKDYVEAVPDSDDPNV
ncbi:MAG TPA: hypothetical protein VLV83_11460 [Acidobacteriota bacterium]|nr:hypothetical protein [Acidobacteriota bacterium]